MRFFRKMVLFFLGGGLYTLLELAWRGRSHSSMFLLGGACFLILGRLRRWQLPGWLRPVVGALVVTALELVVGLAVNRQYRIWDYRRMPLQFLGQICLPYSLLWIPVCTVAMGIYAVAARMLKLEK